MVKEVHMSPMHLAVLEALYNCTEASEEHLAQVTGLPIDTIVRVLHDLALEGFVQRERE
jgi:DNA-binding MarR family transcriptional regulator